MKLSFSLFLLIILQSSTNSSDKVILNEIPLTQSQIVNVASQLTAKFLSSSFINDERISQDTISGTCEYESSNCNGAKINLYKDKELLSSQVLTQNGEFTFTRLKKDEYKVEILFERENISQSKLISTGEHVLIKLRPEQ